MQNKKKKVNKILLKNIIKVKKKYKMFNLDNKDINIWDAKYNFIFNDIIYIFIVNLFVLDIN